MIYLPLLLLLDAALTSPHLVPLDLINTPLVFLVNTPLAALVNIPLVTLINIPSVSAHFPNQPPPLRRPLPPAPHVSLRRDGLHAAASVPVHQGSFDQLIDHANPALGTFAQRYWWNADHYAGPGSPIVLNAPGESAIDGYQGYATNSTLPGAMAQAVRGAAVVLEHRYWGRSSPTANLTAVSLQFLTLQNAMRDVVRFAQVAELPFVRAKPAANRTFSSSGGASPFAVGGVVSSVGGASSIGATSSAGGTSSIGATSSAEATPSVKRTSPVGATSAVDNSSTAGNSSTARTSAVANPADTPWILSGCSYPGALTGWVAALSPGTFAVYHASSAVVQAVSTMCEYFGPVERAMPANCSADFRRVIAHVDTVLAAGDDMEIARLKGMFGFAGLPYNDDFAAALVNGLFDWQNTQFYGGYDPLHRMCDYIENMWPGSNETSAGPQGVGLTKARAGFAKWSREIMIPGSCVKTGYWTDPNTTACFDTHDASSPVFTDTSVANTANRQWMWLLCNEPFEYWQACGAGSDFHSGLVPKLLDRVYWRRQCALFFPDVDGLTYGLKRGRSVEALNALTGGWGDSSAAATSAMDARGSPARGQRIIWTNGEFDPWRPATVSADRRPGGPLASGEDAPVWVIPQGSHCNDLLIRNGAVNDDVARIQRGEIAQVKKWVDEFYARRGGRRV